MKRKRLAFNTSNRKLACTVSAAALMLGVSHAATVGLNFQCDWTSTSPTYTGQHITTAAFGIPPSGWESLLPLPTGYNPDGNAAPFTGFGGPYTNSEVITTT